MPETLGPAIQVRLSPSTRDALADLADREDRPIVQMARILIEQGLVRRRPRKPAETELSGAGYAP